MYDDLGEKCDTWPSGLEPTMSIKTYRSADWLNLAVSHLGSALEPDLESDFWGALLGSLGLSPTRSQLEKMACW